MLRPLVVSIWALACAATAAAQPAREPAAAAGGWHSLRVPGGVSGLLKAAGLADDLPRTRALREVIHVAYDTQDGINADADARRRSLLTYLEAIAAVEALRPARGQPPLSLRQAEDQHARRRLETIADALGCSLEREARVYRFQAGQGDRQKRRRADLAEAGLDVDALVATANAGAPIVIELKSDEVPLPLAPAAWIALVRAQEKLSGSLAAAILGDRSAALFYYGLLGTDAATRDYFERSPALLKDIVTSDRAAVFASVGQSIRVESGRVVVPGGPAAEPLWQDLAGESPGVPDRFILKLLDKDGGRLALLFDAVQAFDPPRRAFALGTATVDTSARADRFRSLYSAHLKLLGNWNPVARPFARNLYDAPHVVAITAVDASGRASGLTSARLWQRAFDGTDVPSDPAAELRGLDGEGEVDAARLMGFLTDVDQSFAVRQNRVEAWLFAQRVFGDAPRELLPDVLVALRGFSRFGVLLCTLERAGVRDPGVYAAAVRQASRISRIKDRERAAVALALFQASVSIVERARTARTLDVGTTESLLRSLGALELSPDDEYLGRVGEWMDNVLIRELASRLPPRKTAREATAEVQSVPVEEIILPAMAGRALSLADSPDLGFWLEGLPYSVDIAGAELARMKSVREKQHGVPLDAGLMLGRFAVALAKPGVTLAEVPRLASLLDGFARSVETIGGPGMAWLDKDWYRKQVASAARDLEKLKKPGDLKKLPRIARPFQQVADRLVAQAALSLAYAAVMPDPQSTSLLDGDPAPRHDWAIEALDDKVREAPPWREPVADRTGGWHLTGSILGADLALAEESLRRVSVDRFPSPPTLTDAEARTVAEGVALIVPFDQSDAERTALVAALAEGRRKLDEAVRRPSLWAGAAAAMHIRDFRRELLHWAIANEPDALPILVSLGELVQLGQAPGDPPIAPQPWGTSGRAYDGRWSLRYPDALTLDLLSGRKGGSLTVGLTPDLILSAAEVMHARRIPAVVTRSVLECAARDAIDEMPLQYYDDWLTLIGRMRIVAGRLDEYLASLTSGGPLVPVAR